MLSFLFLAFALTQEFGPSGLYLSCGDEIQFYWKFHSCVPVDSSEATGDLFYVKMNEVFSFDGDIPTYYVFKYHNLDMCHEDTEYRFYEERALLEHYVPPFAECGRDGTWNVGWDSFDPVESLEEFIEFMAFVQMDTAVTVMFESQECGNPGNVVFARVDNSAYPKPRSQCTPYFDTHTMETSIGHFPFGVNILVLYKFRNPNKCIAGAFEDYDTATVFHNGECKAIYPATMTISGGTTNYNPQNVMLENIEDMSMGGMFRISKIVQWCYDSPNPPTGTEFMHFSYGQCLNLMELGYPYWMPDYTFQVRRITTMEEYVEFEDRHILARLGDNRHYWSDPDVVDESVCPWHYGEDDNNNLPANYFDKYSWEFFVQPNNCFKLSAPFQDASTEPVNYFVKMQCAEGGAGQLYISAHSQTLSECKNDPYPLYPIRDGQCEILPIGGDYPSTLNDANLYITGFCPVDLEQYKPTENGLMLFEFWPVFNWDDLYMPEEEREEWEKEETECGIPDHVFWTREDYCIPFDLSLYMKQNLYDDFGEEYIARSHFETLEDCIFHESFIPDDIIFDEENPDDWMNDGNLLRRFAHLRTKYKKERRQGSQGGDSSTGDPGDLPGEEDPFDPIIPYFDDMYKVGGCQTLFWDQTYEAFGETPLDELCRHLAAYIRSDWDMTRTLHVLDPTCSEPDNIILVESFFEDPFIYDLDEGDLNDLLDELTQRRQFGFWDEPECVPMDDKGHYFESYSFKLPLYCEGVEPWPIDPTPEDIDDQIGLYLKHYDGKCTSDSFVFSEWKVLFDCSVEHIGYEFEFEDYEDGKEWFEDGSGEGEWGDDENGIPIRGRRQDSAGNTNPSDDGQNTDPNDGTIDGNDPDDPWIMPDDEPVEDDDWWKPEEEHKGREEWVKIIREVNGEYSEMRYVSQEDCLKGGRYFEKHVLPSQDECEDEVRNKGMVKLSEFLSKNTELEGKTVELTFHSHDCDMDYLTSVVIYSSKVSEKFQHEEFGECVNQGRATSIIYYDSGCPLCEGHYDDSGSSRSKGRAVGVAFGVGVPVTVFVVLQVNFTIIIAILCCCVCAYLRKSKPVQQELVENVNVADVGASIEREEEESSSYSVSSEQPPRRQQQVMNEGEKNPVYDDETTPGKPVSVEPNLSLPTEFHFPAIVDGKSANCIFKDTVIEMGDTTINLGQIETLGEEKVQNGFTLFKFVLESGDKNVLLIASAFASNFKRSFIDKMENLSDDSSETETESESEEEDD